MSGTAVPSLKELKPVAAREGSEVVGEAMLMDRAVDY